MRKQTSMWLRNVLIECGWPYWAADLYAELSAR